MENLEGLTEVAWYDSEGTFAIIEWDYENKKLIREGRDMGPEEFNPIGDAYMIDAKGRTIPQIVKTVYESTLDNNPDVEIYKKINAFSVGDMLPDYPRDEPFNDNIIINFYQLKDKRL